MSSRNHRPAFTAGLRRQLRTLAAAGNQAYLGYFPPFTMGDGDAADCIIDYIRKKSSRTQSGSGYVPPPAEPSIILSWATILTATDLRPRRAGDGIRNHEAGRFAAGSGEFEAGHFYQQAVKLEQGLPPELRDASVYYQLGRYYEQRKDSGKALANYNRALQIDPEHTYALQARYFLLR